MPDDSLAALRKGLASIMAFLQAQMPKLEARIAALEQKFAAADPAPKSEPAAQPTEEWAEAVKREVADLRERFVNLTLEVQNCVAIMEASQCAVEEDIPVPGRREHGKWNILAKRMKVGGSVLVFKREYPYLHQAMRRLNMVDVFRQQGAGTVRVWRTA